MYNFINGLIILFSVWVIVYSISFCVFLVKEKRSGGAIMHFLLMVLAVGLIYTKILLK